MNLPNIIDIQKFSLHDGDGIRTTVFFKGCNLECAWCHNPESQKFSKEMMVDSEKCVGCEACVKACKLGAIKMVDGIAITDRRICTACGDCVDYCLQNIRALMKELDKDSMIYESSGGGITLSGGEIMMQDIDYIETLCKKIKDKGYNLAIDTCGFAPTENYERILPYVDTFLYDIKSLDDDIHKKYVGQSKELILKNLEFISQRGANINIRIPIVEGVNADDKSVADLIEFIKTKTSARKVNLLPYHSTGSSKYDKLGLEYPLKHDGTLSQKKMEDIKDKFVNAGITDVKIGG
ncbi:MAG: glycyl-radical enzyme activating protein [Anaerovoracaceae bacterium]